MEQIQQDVTTFEKNSKTVKLGGRSHSNLWLHGEIDNWPESWPIENDDPRYWDRKLREKALQGN